MNGSFRNTHRHLINTIVFTICVLGLIALALGNTKPGIAIAVLLTVSGLAFLFHFLLPGGDFFAAVFANSIGIYACIYVFFLNENFTKTGPLAQEAGFVMPLLGFLIGVMWHRKEIGRQVNELRGDIAFDLAHAVIWVLPLVAVGVASFVFPLEHFSEEEQDAALVLAMLIIGLTSLMTARSIAAFLVDTAVLFEDFFDTARRLIKPAFAFLTCYSLLTIVYGCIYTILDRFSPAPNFLIGGTNRAITLPEGLYLSVVTLSTVGYGDLSAVSGVARVIICSEIISGVLLFLFGVQAILAPVKR